MMSSIIAFSGSSSVQRTPASVRKHGPLFQYHRRSVASYAEQRYEYSPSVTLKELNSQAQLTCTAPVEAGEVLVTVPDSSWLDCDAVSSSSIGTATAGCPGWVQLALFLIHAANTNDPDWGTYLKEAQDSKQHPVILWSEDSLQELSGTQVIETAQQYREFFTAQHAQLTPILEQIGGGMPEACTLEHFILSAAVVRSRLLPDFPMSAPSLFPGLQPLAHSRKPTVAISVKSQGLFDKKQSLVVTAARDLAAGEVLSVDMAPGKLESQAVLDYGMYDTANPAAGYMLQLSLPDEEEDRCYYDKEGILEDQGMQPTHTFILRPRTIPSDDMIAFLRLMNIQGADSFLMEPVFRSEVWDFMLQPVSAENEQAVCESMVAGCETALASYSTSLADDLQQQASMSPGEDPAKALALRIRMDEKQVLEGVMEWFRQRQKSLDTLEYYQERRLKRLGLMDDDGQSTFEDMVQINI